MKVKTEGVLWWVLDSLSNCSYAFSHDLITLFQQQRTVKRHINTLKPKSMLVKDVHGNHLKEFFEIKKFNTF